MITKTKNSHTRLLIEEKIIDASFRTSKWLADGNEAKENGNMEKADKFYAKSQFWLDRYNKLAGIS